MRSFIDSNSVLIGRIMYLECTKWIQPFLTVMALLAAVLLVWAQFWSRDWTRRKSRIRVKYRAMWSFPVAMVMSWIYVAMLSSLLALGLAVWGCKTNECIICPWALAFAANTLLMTGLLVLEQLVGTLLTLIKNICHPTIILGETIINKFHTCKHRILWFLTFLFAACGLFLISLNLSGITCSCTRYIGPLFVILAAVFYFSMYCQSLRK